MSFRRLRRAAVAGAVLAVILSGARVEAASKYAAMTEEIGGLLNEALGRYKKGDVEGAKLKTQAAYFEVFENLEGPIRVNVSAKANYELEEEFSAIRRMFLEKEPAGAVEARIAGFMARLRRVVPQLEGGVELTAAASGGTEERAAAAGPGGVEPAWLEASDKIEAGLNGALEARKKDGPGEAAALVNRTFLDHYKNSLLAVAIRSGVSQRRNFDYISRFSDIEGLIASGADAARVEASIAGLVGDLRKDLPGLPFVEGAASEAPAPTAADRDWAETTDALFRELDKAAALFERGDSKDAVRTIQDAYFDVFEGSGMEARIGARDAGFKAALEGHFTLIAGMMKGGVSPERLQGAFAAMKADFNKAAAMLGGAKDSPPALFLYSLTIILREGIEAILIVTMIIAYLVKTGHQDKLKVIYNGCASAVVLSVATAALVKWAVKASAASQETLEGATMLLASGVLFSVSYWLISKIEARKWAAYINDKVGGSLSSRSLKTLWFAAFLAVYREGAETVLFYQALASDSTAPGMTAVAGGFAAGCVLLAGIYLAMRHGAVKLPVRPFFLFTGGLLFYMSFVFSGKGMMELISGRVFEPAFVPWMPAVPFLGVYPYAQTLIPQLLITGAAAVGIFRAGLFGGKAQEAHRRHHG